MQIGYDQGGMFSETMRMNDDKECPNCGAIHNEKWEYCSRRCWEADS